LVEIIDRMVVRPYCAHQRTSDTKPSCDRIYWQLKQPQKTHNTNTDLV